MAVFASDTFTDSDSTELSAHTPDSGGSWTQSTTWADDAVIVSNQLQLIDSATNGTSGYAHSGVPDSAEYDLTWDSIVAADGASQNINVGVLGRYDGDATCYRCRYRPSQTRWQVTRIENGSGTLLGTYIADHAGGTAEAKFEVRDAAKKLFVGGIERISTTDNVITAVGKAGIDFAALGGASNDRHHIDNFVADDLSAGGGTFTATSALTTGGATCSASATHTAPTFAATAAPTTGGAIASASATHTAPVFSSTAALTTGGATAQATAAFTAPVFSGTAALTTGGTTGSASATFATATFTATASLTTGGTAASASGTFVAPVFTGTVALTVGGATASASATHQPPQFTASAALTTGGATSTATATFDAGDRTGTATLIVGSTMVSASATHTAPSFTGTVDVTIGGATFAGVAAFSDVEPGSLAPACWAAGDVYHPGFQAGQVWGG